MIFTYISIIQKRRVDTIVLLNQQPASILGTKVVYSFPFSNKNWTPCSVSYIWCYHNGFALCFLSYQCQDIDCIDFFNDGIWLEWCKCGSEPCKKVTAIIKVSNHYHFFIFFVHFVLEFHSLPKKEMYSKRKFLLSDLIFCLFD